MLTESTTDVSDTKRQLLDAGIALMRKQGYNATSVDQICLAAEVTKGAFFHYFKSKEDLAKGVIQRFRDDKKHEFAAAAFRQLTDPLARIHGRLDYVKESYGGKDRQTKGCLLGMFAQEMAAVNPTLRDLCHDAFMDTAMDLETDLAAAKATHTPVSDFDPKQVSLFYISLIQGSLMLAKTGASNQVPVDNIDHFRTYLNSLFVGSNVHRPNTSPTPTAHSLN